MNGSTYTSSITMVLSSTVEYVGGEWSLKSILSGSDLEDERQRRGSQLEGTDTI